MKKYINEINEPGNEIIISHWAMLQQMVNNRNGQKLVFDTVEECFNFFRVIWGDTFATESEMKGIMCEVEGNMNLLDSYIDYVTINELEIEQHYVNDLNRIQENEDEAVNSMEGKQAMEYWANDIKLLFELSIRLRAEKLCFKKEYYIRRIDSAIYYRQSRIEEIAAI